jgi:acetolactate decarboxylase
MQPPAAARRVVFRPLYRLVAFVSVVLTLVSCSASPAATPAASTAAQNPETLTQVSTYQALQMGEFDGEATFAQLAQEGDFGLGTFDGLDGEMIALDGVFYQALPDGTVQVADPKMETPFADVHFFHSTQQVKIQETLQSVDELTAYLTKQLPSQNRPYAFKISGVFTSISFRSVPKNVAPFPSLQEAVAKQKVFEAQDMRGTLVGYWLPAYLSGVSLPGYHFHFISDDKRHGGHMLKISLSEATVDIDYLENIKLMIPQNDTFQQTDFAKP